MPQNLRLGILVAVASAVFFGVYPAAARFVYNDGGNASFMALLTTGTRALALLAFCFLTSKKLFKRREDTRQGAIGGFFQAVSVLGIFFALNYIPGPVMIIIVFTHTLILLFVLAWKGEAKLDAMTVLSAIVAMIGLSFVLDLWTQKHDYNWVGMALAFMSSLATATRLYVYGKEMKTRNPAVVGAENFVFAVLFLLPIIFYSMPTLPHSATALVLGFAGALAQAAATFGMFYGIALLGSFRFSMFLKLEPIFTALFSIVIMHELLLAQQYMGIALVVGSLVAYQMFESRKAQGRSKPARYPSK